MEALQSIDLEIVENLRRDRDFRREWFRAALETNVPEAFRRMRERRTLTQAELANLAGMKQSSVSRFENSSEAVWKIETLLCLADALDAQLIITVRSAEDAIAEIEREDRSLSRAAKSVLSAVTEERDFNTVGVSALNHLGVGRKNASGGTRFGAY